MPGCVRNWLFTVGKAIQQEGTLPLRGPEPITHCPSKLVDIDYWQNEIQKEIQGQEKSTICPGR